MASIWSDVGELWSQVTNGAPPHIQADPDDRSRIPDIAQEFIRPRAQVIPLTVYTLRDSTALRRLCHDILAWKHSLLTCLGSSASFAMTFWLGNIRC